MYRDASRREANGLTALPGSIKLPGAACLVLSRGGVCALLQGAPTAWRPVASHRNQPQPDSSSAGTLPPPAGDLLCALGQGTRSRRMPREWLDTAENLPKERRRQVGFGQLEDEVSGVSEQPPPGLEQPLLQTCE